MSNVLLRRVMPILACIALIMSMFAGMVFSVSAADGITTQTVVKNYNLTDNSNFSTGSGEKVFEVIDFLGDRYTSGSVGLTNHNSIGEVVAYERNTLSVERQFLTTAKPMDLSAGFEFKATGGVIQWNTSSVPCWKVKIGNAEIVLKQGAVGTADNAIIMYVDGVEKANVPYDYTGKYQTTNEIIENTYHLDSTVTYTDGTSGANPFYTTLNSADISIKLVGDQLTIASVPTSKWASGTSVTATVDPSIFSSVAPTVHMFNQWGVSLLTNVSLSVTEKVADMNASNKYDMKNGFTMPTPSYIYDSENGNGDKVFYDQSTSGAPAAGQFTYKPVATLGDYVDVSNGFEFASSLLNGTINAHTNGFKLDFGGFYIEYTRVTGDQYKFVAYNKDGTAIDGAEKQATFRRIDVATGNRSFGLPSSKVGSNHTQFVNASVRVKADKNGKVTVAYISRNVWGTSYSWNDDWDSFSFNIDPSTMTNVKPELSFSNSWSAAAAAGITFTANGPSVGDLQLRMQTFDGNEDYQNETLLEEANALVGIYNSLETKYQNGSTIKGYLATDYSHVRTFLDMAQNESVLTAKMTKNYALDDATSGWLGYNIASSGWNAYYLVSTTDADGGKHYHFSDNGHAVNADYFNAVTLKNKDLSKGFELTGAVSWSTGGNHDEEMKIDMGAFYIIHKNAAGTSFNNSVYLADGTQVGSTVGVAGAEMARTDLDALGWAGRQQDGHENYKVFNFKVAMGTDKNVVVSFAPFGGSYTQIASFSLAEADLTDITTLFSYKVAWSSFELGDVELKTKSDKNVGYVADNLRTYLAGGNVSAEVVKDCVNMYLNTTDDYIREYLSEFDAFAKAYGGKFTTLGTDILKEGNFDITATLGAGNVIYETKNGFNGITQDADGGAQTTLVSKETFAFGDGFRITFSNNWGFNGSRAGITVGNLSVLLGYSTAGTTDFGGTQANRFGMIVTANGQKYTFLEDATAEEIASGYLYMNMLGDVDDSTATRYHQNSMGTYSVTYVNGLLTVQHENYYKAPTCSDNKANQATAAVLDLSNAGIDVSESQLTIDSYALWCGRGHLHRVIVESFVGYDSVRRVETLADTDVPAAKALYDSLPAELQACVSEETKAKFTAGGVYFTVEAGIGGTATANVSLDNVQEGDQVVLTATPDEGFKFEGWVDQNNRPIKNDYNTNPLTVTAAATNYYKALFVNEATETIVITVKTKNNRIYTYEGSFLGITMDGLLNDNPTLASIVNDVYGYTFMGWKTQDGVEYPSDELITESVTLVPTYEKKIDTYTVSIDTVEQQFKFNTQVTAKSESDAFSYWSEDAKVVSYAKEYTFFVGGDRVLESTNEGSVAAEVILTVNKKWEDDKYNYVLTEWALPEGYSLVQEGVIMTKSADVQVADLKLENVDNVNIRMGTTELTENAGQYMIYTNKNANFKVVAFVQYKNNATNEILTKYAE